MAEAATAGAASAVVVSTAVVVVSVGEVSTGEAFVVVNSVQCEADTCSAAAVSTGVAFVVGVLGTATSVAIFAITDFLMMSSSAASAFPGGGAGAIRTDITVTTITRMIPMDTGDIQMVTGGTRTATTVAGATVTTVALVMVIAMEAARVMDMAMAAEPVTDTALAAEQGIPGVRGVSDKPCYCSLRIRDEATCESSKSVRPVFGDKFGE